MMAARRVTDRAERLEEISSQPTLYGIACCLLCGKALYAVALMDLPNDEEIQYGLCRVHWELFDSDDEGVIGEIETVLRRLAA